jgi:hypothetical protein
VLRSIQRSTSTSGKVVVLLCYGGKRAWNVPVILLCYGSKGGLTGSTFVLRQISRLTGPRVAQGCADDVVGGEGAAPQGAGDLGSAHIDVSPLRPEDSDEGAPAPEVLLHLGSDGLGVLRGRGQFGSQIRGKGMGYVRCVEDVGARRRRLAAREAGGKEAAVAVSAPAAPGRRVSPGSPNSPAKHRLARDSRGRRGGGRPRTAGCGSR